MSFSAILGQEPAVKTLERALGSGKVHHAYRFEGPPGVGKGLAALALARALLCEQPTPLACESCGSCKRAATFSQEEPPLPAHPDLLIVERGLYRSVITASEATGISIEQVRRIVLSRVGFSPHEGRAVVCIVRGADELTVSAANALLKTLEEPPPRTFFLLLTSKPSRLLDTIRSRTLPVRFGPLPDAIVAQLLEARGLDPKLAALAQGSMEQALALADTEAFARRDEFAQHVIKGIEAPDLSSSVAFADKQKLERQELSELLGHLSQVLALRAREVVGTLPEEARRLSRRYEVVRGAVADLERNVGPQLALEAMMAKLRRA
ncbi:MAG TPA: DNA polymerase III subunit [Polyangiaceae bacterium]|nr:DNA polymerase III subunit [Polyangiaceae bacterium]